MIVENRKTAIRVRLRTFFITIIFTTLVIIIYTTRILDSPVLGLSKHHYTIILTSLYLLILVFQYFMNLNFIYFSDQGPSLVFRFYSLRVISSQKRSVEIPKQTFVKFEIHKLFFGLKKNLILYQQIRSSVAKYPPIPITSLTKAEKTAINNTLSKYVKK